MESFGTTGASSPWTARSARARPSRCTSRCRSLMSTRLLLVDDDATLTDTLALGLRKRGIDVTTRTTAPEAMETLESEDFDVVVTDLNMHGVSGIELCERVVANRPDVPVVVLTAFGSL